MPNLLTVITKASEYFYSGYSSNRRHSKSRQKRATFG